MVGGAAARLTRAFFYLVLVGGRPRVVELQAVHDDGVPHVVQRDGYGLHRLTRPRVTGRRQLHNHYAVRRDAERTRNTDYRRNGFCASIVVESNRHRHRQHNRGLG